MKEEQIAQLLQMLQQEISTGKSFVIEQLPLYCQELLIVGWNTSMLWAIVSGVFVLLCLLIGVIFAIISIKEEEPEIIGVTLISCLIGCFPFFPMCYHINNLMLIHYSPRVYILQHLTSLL